MFSVLNKRLAFTSFFDCVMAKEFGNYSHLSLGNLQVLINFRLLDIGLPIRTILYLILPVLVLCGVFGKLEILTF